MKRKDLEMILQRLEVFQSPRADLEQYPTPATIAAEMLFDAYANGDVAGKTVLDLGCGTGVLAIGAKLLGAEHVIGVEVDEKALVQAERNVALAEVEVEFQHMDISTFQGKADTVVMNPPFGSQKKHADRPFLERATECADCIYTLHMTETLDFLARLVSSRGFAIENQKRFKFDIPHTFAFHRKSRKSFDVSLLCLRKMR
ncbi:MAG: ribosomal protein L11 methyltransferase [Methanomassiliicoccales archaeon PtaU1.Bin124]|nr:MAG: ribosomal protein L11 methyltransferase [Methanomassiliicoccales archaeon PtaU1.Bin124]